jgi:hypothetical protein
MNKKEELEIDRGRKEGRRGKRRGRLGVTVLN